MSDKIKKIGIDLYSLKIDSFPDFVVNNEIKKRGIGTGDYKPKIDRNWGDEYVHFNFSTNVEWDFEKSEQLKSIVEQNSYQNSRYEILPLKVQGQYLERLILKHRPKVTQDMLYNHHLIFDKIGYERRGYYDIIHKVIIPENYEPYSYVDNIGKEGIEKKEDALGMIPDRVSAMINSNSIVAAPWFLDDGSDLLEKIGSNFFNAKI